MKMNSELGLSSELMERKDQEVKEIKMMLELENAHQDYEYRKAEIITKLISIRDSEISNDVMKVWVNQAIEFIREKEI